MSLGLGYDHPPGRTAVLKILLRNGMHRRCAVLIIVIQSFRNIFEVFRAENPCVTDRVVLIENILRENIHRLSPECSARIHSARPVLKPVRVCLRTVAVNDPAAVDFHDQTSRIKNQFPIFFLVQYPSLIRTIVRNPFPRLEGMLRDEAVVTSDHVGAGLLRLAKKPCVIIPRNPVVGIDEADPVTLRQGKPDIFRAALMMVDRAVNRKELFRICFLIFLHESKRTVRRAVVDHDDFHLSFRQRLSRK